MIPCPHCTTLLPPAAPTCPHCEAHRSSPPAAPNLTRPIPLLLLGLALAGCGDKEEDDTGDTAEDVDTGPQPEYGVANTGDDEAS